MITLDDRVLEWSGISANELMQEIAIRLYQKQKLTLGQAAKIADMNHIEFQFLLKRNQIPIHYELSDLLEDFETIQNLYSKS